LKILGLIPARGGSKGVPNKNIKLLSGKSLIQRTYECAKQSGVLDRIILSTDDIEIIDHASELGLEVPFIRPKKLAQDNSAMIDVAIHAIVTLKDQNYSPDALLLLQPTSPFRKPEHIVKALNLLNGYDSVCSVIPLEKHLCPHYVMKINAEGFLDYFLPEGSHYTRRQDVPQAYYRDGTIFLTQAEVILKKKNFYGKKCMPMLISPSESLSIDNINDWKEAERRLSNI